MSAKQSFTITPLQIGTEIRLMLEQQAIAYDRWAFEAPSGAGIGARVVGVNRASGDDHVLLVEHAAIAGLSARDAAQLDLPPITQLRARIEGQGAFVRPDFRLTLHWVRANGQNVLGVERRGAWLKEATGWQRLPETLFMIAEAVERHDKAAHEAARLSAVAELRRALPKAAIDGDAEASGIIGSATILEADAMSLTTSGEGEVMQIVPVLHRAGSEPDTPPLLDEGQQREFADTRFLRWQTAQSVYVLQNRTYVAISPSLRTALEVVRRVADGTVDQRRAFLREPRPAIRARIGDEIDAALLDRLVVETAEWSDRVIGLGLWKPRVLPWIVLGGNDWFGEQPNDGPPGSARAGLTVGDRALPLDIAQAEALADRVETAMRTSMPSITEPTKNGPIEVPADQQTLEALRELIRHQSAGTSAPGEPVAAPTVLVIKSNENARDIEAVVRRRGRLQCVEPECLDTLLKPHQREGLYWLQQSWIEGSPGVLLADDMGLGKTLQGLAFLAWLRENMAAGLIERRPILIVAPTGLLDNWLGEHDRHLRHPRLGEPLRAYGKGLATLRAAASDLGGQLDVAALRRADWVLTTYETLRDYVADFGLVHFAAMLIDEAQKVKTPAIRMTDAVKAIRAEFRIAMTGTPVENRLADLWCIVDGVAPGHRGDLRQFSKRYEGEADDDQLASLKRSLDQEIGSRPPLLLRRLKEDRLPDLPPRRDFVYPVSMQGAQLDSYEDALALGRSDHGAGRVLEALQRLRTVSLHPDPDDASDTMLVAGSARLRQTLSILDEIAQRHERALVFLDNLNLMSRLTGLLQRRYRLASPPMMISGTVSGGARQVRVDRFQDGQAGFDVMLISPRAGGVGLTLTRANHVIHLSRWWNPAVEDQCTARVLRIGQELPVSVHVPMAVLADGRRSFDQNLHGLLEAKRRMMRNALLPPEANRNELSIMLDETLG